MPHYNRFLISPSTNPPSSSTAVTTHYAHLDEFLSSMFTVLLFLAMPYLILTSLRNFFQNRNRDHDQHDGQKDQNCLLQLKSMPVIIYGSCSSSSSSNKNDGLIESCSICLAEHEEGEEIRVLVRCKHVFHKECVDRWLVTRWSFCPVCRDRVIERDVEPTATSCRNNGNGGNGGSGVQVELDMRVAAAQQMPSVL